MMQKFIFPLDEIESLKLSLCCATIDPAFDHQKNVLDSVQRIIGNKPSEGVFQWMHNHRIKGDEWYITLFQNECNSDIAIFAKVLHIVSYCLYNAKITHLNEYPFKTILGVCREIMSTEKPSKPKDDRPFEILMQEFIDLL